MLETVDFPILLVPLTCLCVYLYIFYNPRLSIPPGPKPLPLLGNILSIPSHRPWETYASWAHKYKSELLFFLRSCLLLLLDALTSYPPNVCA